MDESPCYEPDRKEPEIPTLMDLVIIWEFIVWPKIATELRLQKNRTCKGAMCPSYHATRNEKDTHPSARIAPEVLTNNTKPNKFDSEELKKVSICVELQRARMSQQCGHCQR